MKYEPTLSGSTVKALFKSIVLRGFKAELIQEKTGIDFKNFDQKDFRVPVNQYNQLLKTAIDLTGDPTFALELGVTTDVEGMGIVSHILFNAENLGEGLRLYERLIKIINDNDFIELNHSDNIVTLIYTIENPDYYSIASIERTFAAIITRMRKYSGHVILPKQVTFQHAEPSYIDKYKDIFQAPVQFKAKQNTLVFDKNVLDLKIEHPSPYVYQVLLEHAEELLETVSSKKRFQSEVFKIIFRLLPQGEMDIEHVSSLLKMSRHTLYRKLKEEGTSFQELVNTTKQKLAKQYLIQNQYSVYEIAFLLGYSEPSAFNRAFKRWENKSPSEFRNDHNF